MSADAHSARDDLAFMRSLVAEGANDYSVFGKSYGLAGLIYGAQILLHAGQLAGLVPATGLWPLAVGLGPTLVFLTVLAVILWRGRHDRRPSPTGRAVNAAFASIGMANLALVAVIGVVAWREGSVTTWLIYPCAVFVLQGAAWLFAWTLRRRAWLGLVAAGWGTAGIAMAVSVESLAWYLLAAGLGFLLCMALPGWIMVQLSRRAS